MKIVGYAPAPPNHQPRFRLWDNHSGPDGAWLGPERTSKEDCETHALQIESDGLRRGRFVVKQIS
jgi:hypothetical protein